MADTESFTLICRKSALVQDISLCPTMDLVAFINRGSRQVSVHRTFTWEKVFSFNSAELFASQACVVSWSPTGRLLAVGSEGGEIALLDVENEGQSIDLSVIAASSSSTDASGDHGASVVHISWLDGEKLHEWSEPHDFEACKLKAETFNNSSLPALIGHVVLKEENDTLVAEADDPFPGLHEGAQMLLLLAAFSDGTIRAFAVGAVPLFRWPLLQAGSTLTAAQIAQSVSISDIVVTCISTAGQHDFGVVAPELQVFRVPTAPISKYGRFHEVADTLLQLQHGMHTCSQAIGVCSRQWKSAPMVLKAKVGLLKGVMSGYNMQTKPSDLLYSVTLCGTWHPAVSQHFAQHWNAQGMTRLRSGIDACTTDIIKLLRLRMFPVAANLVLQAQALVSACYSSDILSYAQHNLPADLLGDIQHTLETATGKATCSVVSIADVHQLLLEGKRLMRKVYHALLEAILTKTRMTTLLDFIQDSADRAKEEGEDIPPYDPSLVREAAKMFDPRCVRKMNDAEELTATHLYAFFEDAVLDEGFAQERHRKGYFELPEQDLYPELFEMVRTMIDDGDDEIAGRSLVTQLRRVEALLKAITQSLCTRTTDSYTQPALDARELPFLKMTCSGSEAVVTATLSTKQWQPAVAADSDIDVSRDGWESTSLVVLIDDLSELYVLAIPQFNAAVTTPHPLGPCESPLGAEYLAAKLRFDDAHSFHKASVYRAEEGAPKKQPPALVALAGGPSPRLVKIPLEDIEFHVMAAEDAGAMCNLSKLRTLPECTASFTSRSLPVDELSSDFVLAACGGRGICTVATPNGRLLVFDLEEDEEGEGDEDDAGSIAEDQQEEEEKD